MDMYGRVIKYSKSIESLTQLPLDEISKGTFFRHLESRSHDELLRATGGLPIRLDSELTMVIQVGELSQRRLFLKA